MDHPPIRHSGQLPLRINPLAGVDWRGVTLQQEMQDGMITRSQLTALGVTYPDIQRLLRRRDLVRVAPAIFVDHTGPLSWRQRAWAAVMHAWPAALSHESVWRESDLIHVMVGPARNLRPLAGSVLHRVRGFEERVSWLDAPPRVRLEDAVLDAASVAPSERAAVGVLTGLVQRRETSFDRLRSALAERERLRRGRWMSAVLEDLATGTNSVLEHGYLVRVERPHGLPTATRQLASRAGGRRAERDAAYERYGVYVELDGRAFHDNAVARDLDLERDLDAAVQARAVTVRLGWGQVFDRSCRTAWRLGTLLQRGGWTGSPTRCPQCSDTAAG